MRSWVSIKAISIAGVLLAAAVLGASCSSETGSSGTSSNGDGGSASSAQGGASSQSSSSSASVGAGGAGGAGCGDTQTDPSNCGTCGNVCLVGLTCTAGACACPVGAAATLSGDVQPIFTLSCVKVMSCHGATAAGKMNLTAGKAYGEIVDVASQCPDGRKIVTPGDPLNSYIMNKLTGKKMCGGKKMPENAASLSATKLEKITSWICAGAPDN